MSWEDQGRQFHGWFGTGTSGVAGVDGTVARGLGAEDVGRVVAAGAAVFLPGPLRAGYERYLGGAGSKELAGALPVWASASGMGASLFHAEVVGAGVGGGFASGLQDVGRLVSGARDASDLRAASERLAGVVAGGGEDWRYWLTYAGDQAAYAAANDLGEYVGESQTQVGPNVGASHASGQHVEDRLVATDILWEKCHRECSDQYIGRGYGSSSFGLYRRCMRECGAIP